MIYLFDACVCRVSVFGLIGTSFYPLTYNSHFNVISFTYFWFHYMLLCPGFIFELFFYFYFSPVFCNVLAK